MLRMARLEIKKTGDNINPLRPTYDVSNLEERHKRSRARRHIERTVQDWVLAERKPFEPPVKKHYRALVQKVLKGE